MNVYHRVLNELNNQNKLIEDIKVRLENLEDGKSTDLEANIDKTEDRGKYNLEQDVKQLDEKINETNKKVDIMNQKFDKIFQETNTLKTQIEDLVAIIESIMKINKK